MGATWSGREVVRMLASMIDGRVLDSSPEFSLEDSAHTSIVVERTSLTPERWWNHCVSNRVASGDDLATCLGTAMLAKPSVVLFAATHGITAQARQFARRVNSTTSMRFVAMDHKDLDRVAATSHALPLLLNERMVLSSKSI